MHIYEVIRCFIKMDFERLSSFITNCRKVVYNKKKKFKTYILSNLLGNEQI